MKYLICIIDFICITWLYQLYHVICEYICILYCYTGSLWESTVDLKVVLGCIQLTCPKMLHGHTKDLSRYRCQVWQRGRHRRSKGGASGWRWMKMNWLRFASCSFVAIPIIGVLKCCGYFHQIIKTAVFRCYRKYPRGSLDIFLVLLLF